MAAPPPEIGQLVEVRRRQWVASDVRASELPTRDRVTAQHLVSLSPIDEDTDHAEISVIWEIEPGAHVRERATLPTCRGVDPTDHLEAFLDAVRWGAATNADRGLLQAPFRSGVEIQAFQLDPLVRALDMARVNLLIADDVGLGKTIEAGLVIQELLIRHRARTVLVVCPSSLQTKWKDEMMEKFGLEFRIIDSEAVKNIRRQQGIRANPWTTFPRLITSMDWAKSGEGRRLLNDVLPPRPEFPRKFDILVVDEAHNVAPAASTHLALPSQRTDLIASLAPHFEHRLFLSATPHNGFQQSFCSLLELLDNQRFNRSAMPSEKARQQVMVRRLKSDLKDENGDPLYPTRKLHALEVSYSAEELEVHSLFEAYVASRRRSAAEDSEGIGAEFLHKLLKKRLFSSPRAFQITLARHRSTVREPDRGAERKLMRQQVIADLIAKVEEDYADDEQAESVAAEAVEAATATTKSWTSEETALLDRLQSWADKATNQEDSKAKAIIAWLEEHIRPGGTWGNDRVILFTEYLATHGWLHERLSARGFGGDRMELLSGGTDIDERERIKAAFQAHPDQSPVRILLATDAASEGIDLQNWCNKLIHVEIPWNPNVMEQRNGRIDRHGQRQSQVHIWHPAPAGIDIDTDTGAKPGDLPGDLEFLARAAIKVDRIRQDLGSVGSVIARKIDRAMTGAGDDLDTAVAEARAAKDRSILVAERDLEARVRKLHDRLMETRAVLQLEPRRIARAVQVALQIDDLQPLIAVARSWAPEGTIFEMPDLKGSWARELEGLHHPHTHHRRPVTFDHALAKGRDDVVLLHLGHRFVQRCLRILRAQVWAQNDVSRINRCIVRTLPDGEADQPIILLRSRLVITGGGHHRLHEELTLAGGYLRNDRFTRIPTLKRLDELHEASKPLDNPPSGLLESLRRHYQQHAEDIQRAIETRSKDLRDSLLKKLEAKKQSEIDDLSQVLDDLAKLLKHALGEEQVAKQEDFIEQMNLEEREQLRRDRDVLRARLDTIPFERAAEIAAIRRRYAEPTARTFPVAVELLVPESFIESWAG